VPDDVDARFAFGYDAVLEHLCGNLPRQSYTRENADYAIQRLLDNWLLDNSYGLIIEHEGRYIGEIRLEDGSPTRNSKRLGICIRDPSCIRKGLGTEAISLVLDFAKGLGLNEIDLSVLESNYPAIRMYERLGFKAVPNARWIPGNGLWGQAQAIIMRRPLKQPAESAAPL
jgi:RimJ/RimL family protein N-acetyltransferase